MTEKAQRKAIEVFCGWDYDEATREMVTVEDGDIVAYPWPSLDAMHEVEKMLRQHPVHRVCFSGYIDNLKNINSRDGSWSTLDAYCATAAQRIEAFLKALDLWH